MRGHRDAGSVCPVDRSEPPTTEVAARRRTPGPIAVVGTLVLLSCIALYLAAPNGVGGLAFVAVSATGLAALLLGPQVRRACPRLAWRWMGLAAGMFLLSLVLRLGILPSINSALASPDLWSIVGYLAALRSLSVMVGAAARGSARSSTLDATIVTAGAALGFFSAELGPHLRRGEALATIVLNLSYPILDAALLALTVHLALRSVRRSPSMVLLLAAMTTWLVADVGYVVLWHVAPFTVNPWLNAGFMLTYALMGAAASHRSVTWLAQPTADAREQSPGTRTLLLLGLLVPAGVAVLSPPSGRLDAGIRVGLLGIVLFTLHLRLTYTIKALSEAASALDRSRAEALHQALHDALTGLPNRAAFLAALGDQLGDASDVGTTLLVLDADNFKQVNDTWGHPTGDAVICGLARRLSAALAPEDRLFRLGGDEFAILLPGADVVSAEDVACRLLAAASLPFPFEEGGRVTMSSSVGLAVARPGEDVTPDGLVRDADIALYRAKDEGRATWALFDDSLRESLSRRVTLAEELRDAVEAGDVVPWFQPVVSGPGFADVCGFEALARWTSPTRGFVGPAEFIPIAEDTGLIVDIGARMLHTACAQVVEWRRTTSRDLHASVNVSAAQMARTDVPTLVEEVLRITGLPPHALWLEITESLLVQDRAGAMETLTTLSQLGVVLAIDDFGTGYSSLSYLKDFPVDVVKVDRSFVKELTTDARSRGVTHAIVEMAEVLGMRGVVAEGVDEQGQADLLESWGCRWGQGFLWSRPLPPAEAEALLTARGTQHSAGRP